MKLALYLFGLFPTLALSAAPLFTPEGVVRMVVTLIVVGIVFGLLYYLVEKAPFIPPEFKTGIKYFLLFVVVLFVIGLLLRMIGYPIF